jgi:hypothetical protein
LPTEKEIAAARRVLKSIKDHGIVTQPDALVLRLYAGPFDSLRPLADIAFEIIKKADQSPEPPTPGSLADPSTNS